MFLDTTYTPTWINLYLMNIDQTGDYLMSKKKQKQKTNRKILSMGFTATLHISTFLFNTGKANSGVTSKESPL